MIKVKITQEQAEAIQRRIDRDSRDEMMNYHADGWVGKSNRCLNVLSASHLARALYIGYEVEPKLKIGDWIYANWSLKATSNVYKVVDILRGGQVVIDNVTNPMPHMDIVRHATDEEIATEKQRIFFDRNGRGVWELKIDDVLVNAEISYTVEDVNDDRVTFNETRAPVRWKTIQNKYKVVCFAEDRLDV